MKCKEKIWDPLKICLMGLQGDLEMKEESKQIGEHVKTSLAIKVVTAIVCAYCSINTIVEITIKIN